MNIIGEMLPEIGYHIRRDCQRKGFAAEAAKAVMDWAFRNTDYPALYSYCNIQMKRPFGQLSLSGCNLTENILMKQME